MDINPPAPQTFAIPANIPWSHVNERYFAFAAMQPPPLDELALDRRLFIGKGGSARLQSLVEVHPLVTCLPWLFDELFPAVSEADLLDITEAGVFLFMGMLLYDAYQDNQLVDHPSVLLLHQQLTLAALRKLHILFDAQSPFWAYFERYYYDYSQALILEKMHLGQVLAYPLERMYTIASGKVALLKTATTALAVKGQGETYILYMERAIDLLAAALQLGDDIVDWPEDYQRQHYTLPLTRAIPAHYWPAPDLSVEEVGRQFEESVILETLILQVIEWFELASSTVAPLNCREWMAFVEHYLTLTTKYQEAFVARKLLNLLNSTISARP
jgi:hypothetical protein